MALGSKKVSRMSTHVQHVTCTRRAKAGEVSWKQHDFGKNVPTFSFKFTYRRERAKEQLNKEKVKERDRRFGVEHPGGFISRAMHLTFNMLTCKDVHKLGDIFFPGFLITSKNVNEK